MLGRKSNKPFLSGRPSAPHLSHALCGDVASAGPSAQPRNRLRHPYSPQLHPIQHHLLLRHRSYSFCCVGWTVIRNWRREAAVPVDSRHVPPYLSGCSRLLVRRFQKYKNTELENQQTYTMRDPFRKTRQEGTETVTYDATIEVEMQHKIDAQSILAG